MKNINIFTLAIIASLCMSALGTTQQSYSLVPNSVQWLPKEPLWPGVARCKLKPHSDSPAGGCGLLWWCWYQHLQYGCLLEQLPTSKLLNGNCNGQVCFSSFVLPDSDSYYFNIYCSSVHPFFARYEILAKLNASPIFIATDILREYIAKYFYINSTITANFSATLNSNTAYSLCTGDLVILPLTDFSAIGCSCHDRLSQRKHKLPNILR